MTDPYPGNDSGQLEFRVSTPDQIALLIEAPELFKKQFGFTAQPGYIEDMHALKLFHSLMIAYPNVMAYCPILILLPEEASLVGLCGFLGPVDDEGCMEIGYGISTEFRGRGFAVQAVRYLVQFAKEGFGARIVTAFTDPPNGPSERVLEKAGFTCVGPDPTRLRPNQKKWVLHLSEQQDPS